MLRIDSSYSSNIQPLETWNPKYQIADCPIGKVGKKNISQLPYYNKYKKYQLPNFYCIHGLLGRKASRVKESIHRPVGVMARDGYHLFCHNPGSDRFMGYSIFFDISQNWCIRFAGLNGTLVVLVNKKFIRKTVRLIYQVLISDFNVCNSSISALLGPNKTGFL